MELFQRIEKAGIANVEITLEEWRKEYANTYNVLALSGSEQDKIFAAQDIITIYLMLQAEKKNELGDGWSANWHETYNSLRGDL